MIELDDKKLNKIEESFSSLTRQVLILMMMYFFQRRNVKCKQL